MVLPVGVAAMKTYRRFSWSVARELDGLLGGPAGADAGGETRRRAVHELDAALAHDLVVRRAEPDASSSGASVIVYGIGSSRYLHASKISSAQSAPCPRRARAEIGNTASFGIGRQEFLRLRQRLAHLAKGLHGDAGHRINVGR